MTVNKLKRYDNATDSFNNCNTLNTILVWNIILTLIGIRNKNRLIKNRNKTMAL